MASNAETADAVRRLVEGQKFGVLATRTGESPYLSLVALAASPDLSRLFFATSRATSKYANLTSDGRVAVLVDDRTNRDADLAHASALTVLGDAHEVEGASRERGLAWFSAKHPSLREFARSPDTALFEVKVRKYILVHEFSRIETFEP